MEQFLSYSLTATQYIQIIFSVCILVRCLRSMLSDRYEEEVWGYIRLGREMIPLTHWENIIGRGRTADVRVDREKISRVHAVLRRRDDGRWMIYDIFSRGGVWVDGQKVEEGGSFVDSDSTVNLAGTCVRFVDAPPEKRERLESMRTSAGHSVSPGITVLELVIFQTALLLQHLMSADRADFGAISLGFGSLIVLVVFSYNAMRIIGRSGFEPEILAFYLTTLGMSVTVSSSPEDVLRQVILIYISFAVFLLLGWWLRGLKRTAALRMPAAVLALGLLALNVLTSDPVNGARNWLEIAGYSFQPSELVKFAYVYVGASTLDRLYRKKNLLAFLLFSAVCVCSLALIGDFGTALVFFVCFLVIAFLRSGSLATVLLAVTGAGMAGILAVSVKPYIAQRFATWGHVWEDVYDTGFQQTRALSAAAAGGLFGKGAGTGWLVDIFAADTDIVFAVVCEELGLIIALCMVLAVLTIAVFAVRTARRGRSAYYAIAACATVTIFMTQMALNVFGSLDLLPFTGVTFPFVSKGGSSLLSCWMLMVFIKGADTRRGGSFVVTPMQTVKSYVPQPEETEL